eukprot:964463-Amorphochlora_amoeboformis.AAC.1
MLKTPLSILPSFSSPPPLAISLSLTSLTGPNDLVSMSKTYATRVGWSVDGVGGRGRERKRNSS